MNKVVVVFLFIAVVAIAFFANNGSKTSNQNSLPTPTAGDTIQEVTPNMEKDEFKIEDEKVGTGVVAETGKSVTVNYKGTLKNGTQFDSSYDRGEPFMFKLGAGDVIQGWDMGVAGMKVGGKRKLTIPAELGYGPQPLPGIPANSTLIFEVELLKVE